jgi:putative addiction module component (TIGR02574 family)
MASLPKNISSLSDVEKFDLLDVLWMDLEAHAADITPEQAEELDRRVVAYEKNPSAVVSWEEVKNRQLGR